MIVHQFNFQFPVILNLPSYSPPSIPRIKHRTLSPIFWSKLPPFTKYGHRAVLRRSSFKDEKEINGEPVKESDFFNENGVVEDMDAYLNFLSLEYESVWDTKPSWCQPWTIWSTGIAIIIGSWLVLNSVVISSVATALICLWWYLFLYSYPKAYSDMIAERRKKVTSGVEDTYGMKTGS